MAEHEDADVDLQKQNKHSIEGTIEHETLSGDRGDHPEKNDADSSEGDLFTLNAGEPRGGSGPPAHGEGTSEFEKKVDVSEGNSALNLQQKINADTNLATQERSAEHGEGTTKIMEEADLLGGNSVVDPPEQMEISTTQGGSAECGEGTNESHDQPKGVEMGAQGQMNEGKKDNGDSQDQSVANSDCHDKSENSILTEAMNKGEGDCPTEQINEGDNHPGSKDTEENAASDGEGENGQFREPSSTSDNPQEEPMELDVTVRNSKSRESFDKVDVQNSVNNSEEQGGGDTKMEVDDVTGQVSPETKSEPEHAMDVETGQVEEEGGGLKPTAERKDRVVGQVDNSAKEVGEPKPTAQRKQDGAGQPDSSVEETGELKPSGEGKAHGTGHADNSAEETGELKASGEGKAHGTDNSAEEMGELKPKPEGKEDGTGAEETGELKSKPEGKEDGTGQADNLAEKQKRLDNQGDSQAEVRSKHKTQLKQSMMMMMTSVMMIVVMVIAGVDCGHLRTLGRIEVATRFDYAWFIMFVQFVKYMATLINRIKGTIVISRKIMSSTPIKGVRNQMVWQKNALIHVRVLVHVIVINQ